MPPEPIPRGLSATSSTGRPPQRVTSPTGRCPSLRVSGEGPPNDRVPPAANQGHSNVIPDGYTTTVPGGADIAWHLAAAVSP